MPFESIDNIYRYIYIYIYYEVPVQWRRQRRPSEREYSGHMPSVMHDVTVNERATYSHSQADGRSTVDEQANTAYDGNSALTPINDDDNVRPSTPESIVVHRSSWWVLRVSPYAWLSRYSTILKKHFIVKRCIISCAIRRPRDDHTQLSGLVESDRQVYIFIYSLIYLFGSQKSWIKYKYIQKFIYKKFKTCFIKLVVAKSIWQKRILKATSTAE